MLVCSPFRADISRPTGPCFKVTAELGRPKVGWGGISSGGGVREEELGWAGAEKTQTQVYLFSLIYS